MKLNKLAVVLSFLLFTVLPTEKAVGQEKYLSKAKKEIDKSSFDEANEYLKKYREKSEETPEYNYIVSLLKERKAMSLYEYEEAYILLKESYKGFIYYPEEIKKDFCKSFNFCDTTCVNRMAALESIIYERYRIARSIEKMNEFILKFPECQFYNDAVDYRDSLAYEQVEKTNTIESYKNFIDTYPDSKLVYNARDNVHSKAFEIAKTTNTIEAYQQFIKDYPKSFQVEKAKQKITDIEYQNTIVINTIEGYKSFLKKHPNSSYTKEIKIFVEDLEWKDADRSGSISAYQNFITTYPNSLKRNDAENKIDDLKKIALPYLLSNRRYKFYDIDKNIFVSDEEFDEVTYLTNGDFLVKKSKLCGIVNRKGIKTIPCKYECINTAGNYYITGMQHKFGLINRNGESIIDMKEDGLLDGQYGFLISGKKSTSEDEYFSGVMNLKGQQVLENVYDYISVVDSSHIIGMKSDLYYLYNGYGQLLTSGYNTLSPANNCFLYSKDDTYGLLGLDGKVKTATNYSYINPIDSNYFSATNSAKKTGVIDIKGNEIIPFGDYDGITSITKKVFALTKYGTDDTYEVKTKLYNIIDKSYISSSTYNSVYSFGTNSIYTQKGNNVQIIDENGSLLFGFTNEPTENEDAYGDEGCGGGGDEEYNYFDCSGYIESNSGYNELVEYNDGVFNSGLSSINVNGKFGYLNKTYEIALPLKYNSGSSFKNGIAQVSLITPDDTYTYNIIDSTGKTLLNGYSILKFAPNNYYAVVSSTENGLGKLYLDNFKFEAYENGISSIDFFNGFNGVRFKDIYYYSTVTKDLRDNNIDFTAFEANKIKTIGMSYYYKQDYNEAIDHLNDAISANSEDADAYYYLSKCYQGNSNSYSARNSIDKAIELSPNTTMYYWDRIEVCKKTRDYNQIINDCSTLLSLNEYNKGQVYFTKGYYESESGYYQQSIYSYTKCISMKYAEANSYNNRGSSYSKLNKNQEALADYKKAISNSSGSTNEDKALYYSNCGLSYYNLKKKTEACSMFRKSLYFSNTYARYYNYYCK